MLEKRYGVQFDYDQRNGTYLVVSLDPLQGKQLVPHQLQMLLNNPIPQLLNVQVDRNNDSYQLQYDLTSKKRLFQMLQTSPPTIHLFYEMAYRLVQTLADSSMYMLNEEQYILHADFIYCGKDIGDPYLCYLPLPTTYSVRVQDQLRLLLLRMLASVDKLNSDNNTILKLIHILQDEDYLILNLKNMLKDAWLEQAKYSDKRLAPVQNTTINEEIKINSNNQLIWKKIKCWFNKQSKSKPLLTKNEFTTHKKITGVTEMLVIQQEEALEEIQVIIRKNNGQDEGIPFLEDRFIVGRHQSGVHYVDATEGVSRVHCEFVKSSDTIEVRDLGSLNGSYLNGVLLVPYKSYSFNFGDVLRIVTTEIRIAN